MSDDAEAFVDRVRNCVGDALGDVWAFDEESDRCLYIRPHVADRLDGHDPSRYIDNERYGYVTRRTHDDLPYASYQYTVRGFDEFTTFRTFLEGFGVLASVDSDAEVAFDERSASRPTSSAATPTTATALRRRRTTERIRTGRNLPYSCFETVLRYCSATLSQSTTSKNASTNEPRSGP